MSITFSFLNSPKESYEEYGQTWERDLWPNANFSNVNACNVLRILGLDPEDYGLTPEQAQKAIPRAIRALNLKKDRETAVLSSEEQALGANFITCEVTDDSVRQRLTQMVEILKFAVDSNESLSWG